jgi:PAS domain S-box-containing protein
MVFRRFAGSWRFISVVVVFLLLASSFVFLEFYGRKIQNGLQGFLYGSGHWMKAQKEATIHLISFIDTQDETYYLAFLDVKSVIEGDRMARQIFMSEQSDFREAYDGLIRGRNIPEDIPDMIWVMDQFRDMESIREALSIWEEGDRKFAEVEDLSESLFDDFSKGEITEQKENFYRNQLIEIDSELTRLVDRFNVTIRQTAQQTGDMVYWISISITLGFILLAAGISIFFMRSLEKTNRKLDESAQMLTNVLDNSRDVIYQYKPGDRRYDYMSSSVEEMLGYSKEEVLNGGPQFIVERIHPDDLKRVEKKLEELNTAEDTEELLQDTEFRVMKKNGDYIWVNNKRKPVLNADGKVETLVGNVRDISEEKRRMDEIDQSLREKQMLLSEIHHRVKNNLAIVSSLIELQKERLSQRGQEELAEVQMRIKSIALVHDKLYSTSSFSDINLSQYARELTEMIKDTYRSDHQSIEIKYHLEDLTFNISNAVTMALILNEMVNNCFKHAFKHQEEGVIDVTIQKEAENILLEVADSGASLPDDFDPNSMQTMGMTLIHSLAMQLQGELEIWADDKTHFRIRFPDVSI